MKPFVRHALLLALLLATTGVCAEEVTDKNLIETFNHFIEPMRDSDYGKMSKHMHPGELDQYQQDFVGIAKKAQENGVFDELSPLIGGIESVETLEKLSAQSFL